MTCSILSVVLGGVITIIVSFAFYVLAARDLKRAAQELRNETKKLIHLMNLDLRVNERDGKADFRRDESGEIVGEHLHFKTNVAARSQTSPPNLQVDDLVEVSDPSDHDRRREE
jgi:hypothetical protein